MWWLKSPCIWSGQQEKEWSTLLGWWWRNAVHKGFIWQKMLKWVSKDKFSQIGSTEGVRDEGRGRQGHLRLRKHDEERQRNMSAEHVCKRKQFSMAETKRRQSPGVRGKEEEWESSTLREKVKRQASVSVQKTLYALDGRPCWCSSNTHSPFSTVTELSHFQLEEGRPD